MYVFSIKSGYLNKILKFSLQDPRKRNYHRKQAIQLALSIHKWRVEAALYKKIENGTISDSALLTVLANKFPEDWGNVKNSPGVEVTVNNSNNSSSMKKNMEDIKKAIEINKMEKLKLIEGGKDGV